MGSSRLAARHWAARGTRVRPGTAVRRHRVHRAWDDHRERPVRLPVDQVRGRGRREVFDRRKGRDGRIVTINVFRFTATYADGAKLEARVNPEFGSRAKALTQARKYARVMGLLPRVLRAKVKALFIHKGNEDYAGGQTGGVGDIAIHIGRTPEYERAGALEEILVHEATHAALDPKHARQPAGARHRGPTRPSSRHTPATTLRARTSPRASFRGSPSATGAIAWARSTRTRPTDDAESPRLLRSSEVQCGPVERLIGQRSPFSAGSQLGPGRGERRPAGAAPSTTSGAPISSTIAALIVGQDDEPVASQAGRPRGGGSAAGARRAARARPRAR